VHACAIVGLIQLLLPVSFIAQINEEGQNWQPSEMHSCTILMLCMCTCQTCVYRYDVRSSSRAHIYWLVTMIHPEGLFRQVVDNNVLWCFNKISPSSVLYCVGRRLHAYVLLFTSFCKFSIRVFDCSLAVVENLWEKSKGEFVYSFSESVHPIVPQKKNSHELGLGNYFHSTLNFRLKLGSKIPWMKG